MRAPQTLPGNPGGCVIAAETPNYAAPTALADRCAAVTAVAQITRA